MGELSPKYESLIESEVLFFLSNDNGRQNVSSCVTLGVQKCISGEDPRQKEPGIRLNVFLLHYLRADFVFSHYYKKKKRQGH